MRILYLRLLANGYESREYFYMHTVTLSSVHALVCSHTSTLLGSPMCALPDICGASTLVIPERSTTGIIMPSEAKSPYIPRNIRQVRDASPENR